jgi:hypothetical protein
LFRIAHNAAIDFFRDSKKHIADRIDETPPLSPTDDPLSDAETARLAFSVYRRVTPLQRSCVILKDVMGHSNEEISETLDISVGAVKAALHRGRNNLRKLGNSYSTETEQLDQADHDVSNVNNESPSYRVLISWHKGRVTAIRDFRYSRNLMQDASIVLGRQ